MSAAQWIGAVEPDVEEDQDAGDDGDEERRRAGNADGEEADPDKETEAEPPQERREAGAEGRWAQRVHVAGEG